MRTLEDKEYSWNALLDEGFPVDDYEFPDFEGAFQGTLDCKCWGFRKLSGSLIASVTLDDGRKIKFACWKDRRGGQWAENWHPYGGLRDVHVGDKIKVVFVMGQRSGRPYVASITPFE